jgi:hypothetical protein
MFSPTCSQDSFSWLFLFETQQTIQIKLIILIRSLFKKPLTLSFKMPLTQSLLAGEKFITRERL